MHLHLFTLGVFTLLICISFSNDRHKHVRKTYRKVPELLLWTRDEIYRISEFSRIIPEPRI